MMDEEEEEDENVTLAHIDNLGSIKREEAATETRESVTPDEQADRVNTAPTSSGRNNDISNNNNNNSNRKGRHTRQPSFSKRLQQVLSDAKALTPPYSNTTVKPRRSEDSVGDTSSADNMRSRPQQQGQGQLRSRTLLSEQIHDQSCSQSLWDCGDSQSIAAQPALPSSLPSCEAPANGNWWETDTESSRIWKHIKFLAVILMRAVPRALPKMVAAIDLVANVILFSVAEYNSKWERNHDLHKHADKSTQHELSHYRFVNALVDIEIVAIYRAFHMMMIPVTAVDILHRNCSTYSLSAYIIGALSVILFVVKISIYQFLNVTALLYLLSFLSFGLMQPIIAMWYYCGRRKLFLPARNVDPSSTDGDSSWLLGGFVDGTFSQDMLGYRPFEKYNEEEASSASLCTSARTDFVRINGIDIHYVETRPQFNASRELAADSHACLDDGEEDSSRSSNTMGSRCCPSMPDFDPAMAIVLIHGYSGSTYSWSKIIDSISQQCACRVIAFDRPGFGLTRKAVSVDDLYSLDLECPTEENNMNANLYSLDFQYCLLINLCRCLDINRVVVVSHDDGALLALHTAAKMIEESDSLRVSVNEQSTNEMGLVESHDLVTCLGIVLISPIIIEGGDTRYYNNRTDLADEFQSEIYQSLTEDDDAKTGIISTGSLCANVTPRFVRMLLQTPLPRRLKMQLLRGELGSNFLRRGWFDSSKLLKGDIEAHLEPFRCDDWMDLLMEITKCERGMEANDGRMASVFNRLHDMPCLILAGENDKLIPERRIIELAARIDGAVEVRLPSCGHFPHNECPEMTLKELALFVSLCFDNIV